MDELTVDRSKDFIRALKGRDIELLRSVPKADLHNHCLLGLRIEELRMISGAAIRPFQYRGNGILDINDWIKEEYAEVLRIPGIFPKLVEASFRQAAEDGVTLLEMSLDAALGYMYNIPVQMIADTLKKAHRQVAPQIVFRPCLGFQRNMPVRNMLRFFESCFDLGFFSAIDIYDDEKGQPVQNFRELFRFAKRQGIRCTAHVGEFGTAEDVREAVDVLGLDAVQHGIAAASSPGVMRWLSDRNMPLNICPTSNIILGRVSSYATHPIRILYDNGVKVTVNTDDVTLFGQGVSEEFLNLYRAQVFSAEEMEEIRLGAFEQV